MSKCGHLYLLIWLLKGLKYFLGDDDTELKPSLYLQLKLPLGSSPLSVTLFIKNMFHLSPFLISDWQGSLQPLFKGALGS